MSTIDPGSTGKILGNFRLIERASTSVWRAEDTRSGKNVAAKFLSKQLPKDAAKREALVREVRQGAAHYHSFLIAVQEIAVAGDALLLVMEWLDGQAIAKRVRGRALDRTEFFRVSYQIVDALKLLHAKDVIHGNIAGDSIIILPSGQTKLGGLNLSNILLRQGQPSAFQLKGNDMRAVSYMAPEQISNQPVTPQTDIYSLGLVLYEAATGRLPYQGATAAEVARKIVDEQPPSPKSVNPNIDNAVLSVMGGCLFKDPFKRHKDTKALLDAIIRVEPDSAKFAAEVAKSAAAPAPSVQQAQSRNSILFVADVANYDELNTTDPAAAAKSAARMQQILGEAIYLFDGKVLDPFGPRLIGELPSIDSAIEAGRKGEFDFSADQQSGEVIPVRMLLHAGEVQEGDGSVSGAGVAKGIAVLKHLQPLTLYVSEDFARRGKPTVRLRDSGARAGVKLFTIVPPEPQVEHETELETAVEEVGVAAEVAAAEEAQAAAAKRKKQRMMITVVAIVALIVIAGGAILLRPKSQTQTPVVTKGPEGPAPATATTPRKVLLTIESLDPALTDRANAVRGAAVEILRSFPEVRVADAAAPDVTAFTAQVRTGTAGPEIVVDSTPATPAPDTASAIQPLLQFITSHLRLPQRSAASADAYNAFADAVTASAANDVAKTDAALRAATKADPNFVAAQMMAMRFFATHGKQADAVDAARHVLTTQPENLDAARMVARASLGSGDLSAALGNYAVIARKNPADPEALNVLGKYAVAANDAAKLAAVLRHLAAAPVAAEVHEPDLLLASGKIDAAVGQYYTIEEKVSNNPALSLKIGRIAVLRHSTPIAELELKKLQESDPLYSVHILKAYIAAQAGNKTDSAIELKTALAASTPGDDYWTSVAEVAAIQGDANGILDALERAAQRKEPTASYILNDPLFTFLQSDPRFQKVRDALLAEQNEIRGALASVSL